jgi:hypothetical protein
VQDTTFNRGNRAKFTALKVSKQFPLVLLVKVVWRGSKTFGSEEDRDERWSKERSWAGPNCTQLQPPSSDTKPCKMLVFIIFITSVRTSKRTEHFTIKTSLINAVYNEKHEKPIIQNAELLIIKAVGTCIYQ